MPARKPNSLNRRHNTAAENQARIDAESAMTPESDLSMKVPSKLNNHPIAQKAWKNLIGLYNELEGAIVSALDFDLLVDYCLMMEQAAELDQMRKEAVFAVELLKNLRDQQIKNEDLEKAERTAAKMAPAIELVAKIDARVDGKRKELNKMRTYLYLTPRSRAGVSPNKKEEDQQEMDPMAMLLGEVTDYVNGENGDQDK
ncbi:MAG: hypothetical protein CL609_23755 [Anaerolineaceae bacterium]|nr:hypothetical protein [Anaerolineaceae bacterium]